MSATGIRARGLARTWPDGTVGLHPCDVDVAPGEVLVLLGPSGCGKTTMLRLLAGLERPDPGGRVLYGEDDVTQVPIERRGVGMVFQSYALFPNMDVAGNVAYGPRLKGLSRRAARERAERYMALCRIEALAHRRIDQLSGGQRQRVALARALAAEPRALFLDEPLTALDAALREALRAEIAAVLAAARVTAIYVTHDQAEAMALANRIAVMNAGAIEQVGTAREVYEAPASLFVARFVGETVERPGPGGAIRLHRPEHVRLLPAGEGRPARVAKATYFGAVTRLTLETEDGPLPALDHEGRRLGSGDVLGYTLDEARALVFPDPEAP